jgi:glycosyltransferase involved in cell wall biosynthesis
MLFIALPTYNEATVLREVIRLLKESGYHNILIVDDGSKDDTPVIALEEGAILVSHVCNRGAGAASQTALEWARNNSKIRNLVLMDADGQHHVEDIELLIDSLSVNNWDIVIGNRFHGTNEIPRTRILFNRIANGLTNFFCTQTYKDTQSGFRVLGRRAIEKLDLKVDGFGFCSEMLIVAENLGLEIGEVPIKVSYSAYSMSKGQSLGKGITTALQFFRRILLD